MQSPLQVTIMATLVERLGEPPRQRYRLFEQYYRTIYEREVGREGVLSEILSGRKTDIDLIHYRTGLVLQTESERAGATEARLTDERFRALVRARLDEVEVDRSVAEDLLTRITAGSLDRLVFLIRPQAGLVGFELRSLQEFMAAEALLKGSDEAVRARLRHIAPISHWRNVLLFAVGKCFAEHEHLLETIDFICRELNDKAHDPVSEFTLWGARLALDILMEGVAKPHPKFERSLAKNALQLVALPDVNSNVKLAAIYDEQLNDLFVDAVNAQLERSEGGQHVGIWALLSALADRDVQWATEIVRAYMRSNNTQVVDRLVGMTRRRVKRWALDLLIETVPRRDPQPLTPFYRLEFDESCKGHIPAWFTAIERLYGVRGKRDGVFATAASFTKTREALALYSALSSHHFAELVHLQDVPSSRATWTPMQSIGRFCGDPSSASLARELRCIADNWGGLGIRALYIPWPLGACIAAARSASDLHAYADRADRGLLGNRDDWLAAEHRWRQFGVRMSDIEFITDEQWPFDDRIAAVGFPFVVASTSFSPETAADLLAVFHRPIAQQFKDWIALQVLGVTTRFDEEERSGKLPMSPDEFLQLCESARRGGDPSVGEFLCLLVPPALPDPEWARAFDWLSNRSRDFELYIGTDWPWTALLQQSFLLEPLRFRGLISLLGQAAIAGNPVQVPASLLQLESYTEESQLLGAIQLHMIQDDLADDMLRRVVTAFASSAFLRENIFRLIRSHSVPVQNRCKLILQLRDRLRESNQIAGLRTAFVSALGEVLEKRSSNFSDIAEWQRLALPRVTHPGVP